MLLNWTPGPPDNLSSFRGKFFDGLLIFECFESKNGWSSFVIGANELEIFFGEGEKLFETEVAAKQAAEDWLVKKLDELPRK